MTNTDSDPSEKSVDHTRRAVGGLFPDVVVGLAANAVTRGARG